VSPLLLRRLSDEQLGSRLAAGEAAAFDELYRRYVHRLAAYGAHLLGDGSAGDDVAQSALLNAYAALRDGRVPAHVRPWLYRIAHNAAIDLVKRRRELLSDALPDVPAPAVGGDTGALVTALAALPDRQRRAYVLRELHGLRVDETAAELGLTPPQVEQALFAARNRLAEHLVFGDRLNCVAVRRLVAGPLDLDERRALKTHLRSCAGCRHAVGRRGRALALPVAPLDWLRALGGLLVGGGVPAAAKVGVLVAGASVAAGVPMTVERTNHRAVPPVPAVQRTAAPRAHRRDVAAPPAVPVVRPAATVVVAAAPPTVSPAPAPVVERRREQPRVAPAPARVRRRDGGGDPPAGDGGGPGPSGSGPTGSGPTGSGPSGSETAAPQPAVTTLAAPPPEATTTTNSGEGSDGGGGSSGRDGGSGSGSGDGGSGSGDGGSGGHGGGSDGSG
jgi:DNA-directed RNA polymerase specialized sigma24 family protein